MNNPYLSIDKKYFKKELQGNFAVSMTDIINIPKLSSYFDVSFLKDNKIIFDSFEETKKMEIGIIMLEAYGYISWYGKHKYLNFETFFDSFGGENELNYEISKLKNSYYLDLNPSTYKYKIDYLPSTFLMLLLKYFFYSMHSDGKEETKYIKSTEVLTDINFNKYQYIKVDDNVEFIINLFKNWINTRHGSIPFSPEYGNSLKELLHEKNVMVKSSRVKDSISKFFTEIEETYKTVSKLKDITINIIGTFGLEIIIDLNIDNKDIKINLISEGD